MKLYEKHQNRQEITESFTHRINLVTVIGFPSCNIGFNSCEIVRE